MFTINVCRWLDSKCGPLVLEAIALPADLQPLPLNVVFWTSIMKIEFHFLLFNQPSYYILIRTHFNRAIALAPRKGEGGGGHRGTIHEQCDQMLVWKVRPSFSKKLPKKKPLQFLLQKMFSNIALAKYFGYFSENCCQQDLTKVVQSGRTVHDHRLLRGKREKDRFSRNLPKKWLFCGLEEGGSKIRVTSTKWKSKVTKFWGKCVPFYLAMIFFIKEPFSASFSLFSSFLQTVISKYVQ